MATKNYYEGVESVVQVNTNIERSCKHCTERVGGEDGLSAAINHYIERHGYKLLHVGTETSQNIDGKLWHSTVAVLGK